MSDHRTCRHPDRDEPRLMCGYPLPCPHHTAVIDLEAQTVTIPLASDAMKSPARERIGQVGRVCVEVGHGIDKDPLAKQASGRRRRK